MTIEQQVCTLEQAKRLKELGVVQDSMFHFRLIKPFKMSQSSWYTEIMHENVYIEFHSEILGNAYTSAEIINMYPGLGGVEYSEHNKKFYRKTGIGAHSDGAITYYDNFTQAITARLIKAIEKDWVSVTELNNKLG